MQVLVVAVFHLVVTQIVAGLKVHAYVQCAASWFGESGLQLLPVSAGLSAKVL